MILGGRAYNPQWTYHTRKDEWAWSLRLCYPPVQKNVCLNLVKSTIKRILKLFYPQEGTYFLLPSPPSPSLSLPLMSRHLILPRRSTFCLVVYSLRGYYTPGAALSFVLWSLRAELQDA